MMAFAVERWYKGVAQDTEDACFGLNASRPIAKGDLKWRDALLVAQLVNSNKYTVDSN